MQTILLITAPDTPTDISKTLAQYLPECRLITASTELEGLEVAKSRNPDTIVVDMPDMPGYETCRKLKSTMVTKSVPVIALFASIPENREMLLSHPADILLPQSLNPLLLLSWVNTFLRIKKKEKQLSISLKKELAEVRDHYCTLVDSIADAVIVAQDRKIVFVNKAFVTMFEFSNTAEAIGFDPLVLLAPSFRDSFGQMYASLRQEEKEDKRFEALWITRNGREFWSEGNSALCRWGGSKSKLTVLRDINELKMREITLENESENIKKVKDGLMAGMGEYFRYGDLIGKSRQMQTVYEHIINAAATDANVIILGESGTGKELVARAIHKTSDRKDHKIIPVNCGAIPEPLLESEFFGYKKGAFSGAHTDKNGYLDIADKGTLFLDEVGEIGLNIQVKLLRVIDGEGFIPLGGTRTRKPDVRIICATNRNLKDLVRQGLLREDFYYRINVIPIDLPPLRERKEDISYLVDHFMVMHDPEHKSPPIPAKAWDVLRNYHWPGNVRELNSVIQRYITFKKFMFLGLPVEIEPEEDNDAMEQGCDLVTAQHNFEKKFILQTLTRHNWHRGKTASALNISRKTLFRKMKTLDLGQV